MTLTILLNENSTNSLVVVVSKENRSKQRLNAPYTNMHRLRSVSIIFMHDYGSTVIYTIHPIHRRLRENQFPKKYLVLSEDDKYSIYIKFHLQIYKKTARQANSL